MTGGQRLSDPAPARLYVTVKRVLDALEETGFFDPERSGGAEAEGLCRQLFLGFSPEEQEQLARLLQKVCAALQ